MKLLKMKPDSDQPMIALKLTDVARQENVMPKPVHKPSKQKRPAAAPPSPVGIRRPAAVAASASPPPVTPDRKPPKRSWADMS